MTTTLQPLARPILRDEQGNPRRCQLCPIRLATTEVHFAVWSIDLCDDCAAAREIRMTEIAKVRA